MARPSFSGLAALLVLLSACTPVLRARFATAADIQRLAVEATEQRGTASGSFLPSCYRYENYIPDTLHPEHMPMRYIRINFHFVNSSDSAYNYTGDEARRVVRELLSSAQHELETNNKMWLPPRNVTPVLPTRYRYVLTPQPGVAGDDGIYCHFDDEGCFYIHKGAKRNLMDRSLTDRYAVQPDSVINIFIMPHHPDSIVSPTYSAGGVGVALGNVIKMAGLYENGGPGWNYRGVLNHEIGHVLGLSHTWAFEDGCDDTPRHNGNCWNRSSKPPCDTMASNNLMDYNAMQNAWTPCQIGKIQAAMARESSQIRAFLEPRWCQLKEDRTLAIRDSVSWNGARDLEGHIVIEQGGVLRIGCRVSLPAGARISVYPGGTLILDPDARLHNACGGQWVGIELVEQGKKRGQVIFVGEPKLENMASRL